MARAGLDQDRGRYRLARSPGPAVLDDPLRADGGDGPASDHARLVDARGTRHRHRVARLPPLHPRRLGDRGSSGTAAPNCLSAIRGRRRSPDSVGSGVHRPRRHTPNEYRVPGHEGLRGTALARRRRGRDRCPPSCPSELVEGAHVSYVVDFEDVSTVGLESSPVAEALAGLRANEARYFKNKYDHVFTVEPASTAKDEVAYVHRILQEERDIVIGS